MKNKPGLSQDTPQEAVPSRKADRRLSQPSCSWPELGLSPLSKHRKAEVRRQPTGWTWSTQHGLHLAVKHLSPRRRWLQVPAGVRRGQDEVGGCPFLPQE